MINFVQHRKWYYLFSGTIIVIGIIAMFISTRTYAERSIVRLSIDFVGGSLFEARFAPVEGQTPQTIEGSELEGVFAQAELSDVTAQRLGLTDTLRWQVRTSFVGNNNIVLDKLIAGLNEVAAAKNLTFDEAYFRDNLASVSPAVGNEAAIAAIVATFFASLLVMGWIAFAFRQLKHSFRYGVCALLAMLHDLLVIASAISIAGLVLGWEADALFLTAVLTVVGYSVQDTIVLFDRVRENDIRRRGEPFELIVNRSIMETVQRSLMTQIAVAFVLFALFLIGSGTIREFVGVLFIGLLSGSYSSIFIAVPLLVSWEKGELPFVNRGTKAA
ncbi:MAG: protein translocase subunit SecF [Anaerolinea sp.]|nr:protein translocase subunit SecF [Anaerolinea sp.]CAG0975542.1 Protein translocase subunit SecDF [Anaerolineae bacterium]